MNKKKKKRSSEKERRKEMCQSESAEKAVISRKKFELINIDAQSIGRKKIYTVSAAGSVAFCFCCRLFMFFFFF